MFRNFFSVGAGKGRRRPRRWPEELVLIESREVEGGGFSEEEGRGRKGVEGGV